MAPTSTPAIDPSCLLDMNIKVILTSPCMFYTGNLGGGRGRGPRGHCVNGNDLSSSRMPSSLALDVKVILTPPCVYHH